MLLEGVSAAFVALRGRLPCVRSWALLCIILGGASGLDTVATSGAESPTVFWRRYNNDLHRGVISRTDHDNILQRFNNRDFSTVNDLNRFYTPGSHILVVPDVNPRLNHHNLLRDTNTIPFE